MNTIPFLTGSNLRNELDRPNLGTETLIEELIYKDTITMFYAKPGVGKSVVTTNMAGYGSVGKNIFDFLKCSHPLKFAYCQMEGSRDEQLSRLKAMEESIGNIDTNNITWHTPSIIAEESSTWGAMFNELENASPFDIAIFDPIYAMTAKGLVQEASCLAVKKILDTVKNRFKCAVIVNNHSPKDMINYKGEKIKKEDPFGTTWLLANVDSSYFIDRESESELIIENKKSRGSNIIKSLVLSFDVATFTLKALMDKSSMKARHKVQSFLFKKFDVNSFATTMEICRECNISLRHLLRMKADGYFTDMVLFKDKGRETLWMKKLN